MNPLNKRKTANSPPLLSVIGSLTIPSSGSNPIFLLYFIERIDSGRGCVTRLCGGVVWERCVTSFVVGKAKKTQPQGRAAPLWGAAEGRACVFFIFPTTNEVTQLSHTTPPHNLVTQPFPSQLLSQLFQLEREVSIYIRLKSSGPAQPRKLCSFLVRHKGCSFIHMALGRLTALPWVVVLHSGRQGQLV